MSLMDKIRKVLDEKVEDKKKDILDESEVEYKIDEETGEPLLDEDGNKIPVDEEKDKEMDDEKGEKKDKKDMKGDDEEVDVKESLAKVFEKADLDESLLEDLETLFNVAVDQKVEKIKEAFEAEQVEAMAEAIDEIAGNVNKYITYAATEWISENEIAVDAGIKNEIAENLIEGMKNIFEESYVEVPESKVDLVSEAEDTIDNLLTVVDEQKEAVEALQTELNDIKSKKVVDELAGEMTDTQKEKLVSLTDSIEYKDDSDYRQKVGVIIESYFGKDAKDDLNEDIDLKGQKKDEGGTPDRLSQYKDYFKSSK